MSIDIRTYYEFILAQFAAESYLDELKGQVLLLAFIKRLDISVIIAPNKALVAP